LHALSDVVIAVFVLAFLLLLPANDQPVIFEQNLDIVLIYARHFRSDLDLVVRFTDIDFRCRWHLPERGTKDARQSKPAKGVVEEAIHFAAHCQEGIRVLAPPRHRHVARKRH
jgi:hypothetical protein